MSTKDNEWSATDTGIDIIAAAKIIESCLNFHLTRLTAEVREVEKQLAAMNDEFEVITQQLEQLK